MLSKFLVGLLPSQWITLGKTYMPKREAIEPVVVPVTARTPKRSHSVYFTDESQDWALSYLFRAGDSELLKGVCIG